MKTPPEPLTLLCAHVISTLPDSLESRRGLLEAMHVSLTPNHPLRREVRTALEDLNAVRRSTEVAQLKFAKFLGGAS